MSHAVLRVVPGCKVPHLVECGHHTRAGCQCGELHHVKVCDDCHRDCTHPGVHANNECGVCGAHWVCYADAQRCNHHPQYGGRNPVQSSGNG